MSHPEQPGTDRSSGSSPASEPSTKPVENEWSGWSRRRSAAWFGGLAVAGLTAGIVAGRVTGGGGPPETAALRPSQVVAVTQAPTTPATTPAAPTPTPAPSPTPTKKKTTPKPKPIPADYSPIPLDAAGADDLDFGFLTNVKKNGDLVTVSFDRASFYSGEEAVEKNGGTAPDNDYLIENTQPTIRDFSIDAKAPLIGVSRLAPSAGPIRQVPLDPDAFLANATRALATGLGIPVWVRHSIDANGPVTSLAEQYIP